MEKIQGKNTREKYKGKIQGKKQDQNLKNAFFIFYKNTCKFIYKKNITKKTRKLPLNKAVSRGI